MRIKVKKLKKKRVKVRKIKPKRRVQAFDETWDLKWYEDRLAGREQVFTCVAEICKDCKTVLDAGGGPGFLKRFIPDTMLDVVDLSPKAKELGEEIFPEVTFVTGTIDMMPDTYDAVVGIQIVEHMNGYTSFIKTAWNKARKMVVITFRNGFNRESRRRYRGMSYWDNSYSFQRLWGFINSELHPSEMEIKRVEIDRDYSPELVMVLHK